MVGERILEVIARVVERLAIDLDDAVAVVVVGGRVAARVQPEELDPDLLEVDLWGAAPLTAVLRQKGFDLAFFAFEFDVQNEEDEEEKGEGPCAGVGHGCVVGSEICTQRREGA